MMHWVGLLGAGVLAGFLNAAASSGSAITLPLLLAIGLPPVVANGTNRLPVLVGFLAAIWRFQKAGAIPWRLSLQLLPIFLVSALLGANLASMLPMGFIRLLVHVALVLALAMVLIQPQRWLKADQSPSSPPRASLLLQLLMAGVGVWTGLIVLDTATYLLVSLVLVGGVALQPANAIKAVLLGIGTVVSLAVFIHGGQVDWPSALPLTLGSAVGGWLGASLALGPNARVWIYRLLIGALGLEVVAMGLPAHFSIPHQLVSSPLAGIFQGLS